MVTISSSTCIIVCALLLIMSKAGCTGIDINTSWMLKPGHQIFVVPYSTDNHSNCSWFGKWHVLVLLIILSFFQGSGKTFTMMGNQNQTGLIPRLCDELFDKISKVSYIISVFTISGQHLIPWTRQLHFKDHRHLYDLAYYTTFSPSINQ